MEPKRVKSRKQHAVGGKLREEVRLFLLDHFPRDMIDLCLVCVGLCVPKTNHGKRNSIKTLSSDDLFHHFRLTFE